MSGSELFDACHRLISSHFCLRKIPISDSIMWSFTGIMLLLLHQGYSRITVLTVQLGEPGSLMCVLPSFEYSNARIKWYKQSIDDSLVLITTVMKGTTAPTFEEGFPSSRFEVNYTETMSTLTILETIPEDEAVYHCAVMTWSEDNWSATFLSLEGNIQRTSPIAVVQWPTVYHPVGSGDSISLQCSVLTGSQRTTCPSDHSVHLSVVRSDKSHGTIIYTEGGKHDECDKKPDERSSAKSCVYHFSKNVSSPHAETYYCAVATCGEIIFGTGTGLDNRVFGVSPIIMLVLCGVLVTSLVLALLIYCMKRNKLPPCGEKAVALKEKVAEKISKRNEDTAIYSAAIFTMVTNSTGGTRVGRSADAERIYAAVKAFGWD